MVESLLVPTDRFEQRIRADELVWTNGQGLRRELSLCDSAAKSTMTSRFRNQRITEGFIAEISLDDSTRPAEGARLASFPA